MVELRLQLQVAAFVEVAAVVLQMAGQRKVGRPLDTLVVAQLYTPLLLLPGNARVGKQLVVGAAVLVNTLAKRIVVVSHVLVTQAHTDS